MAQEFSIDVARARAVVNSIKDVNMYELRQTINDVPDVVASDSSRVLRTYSSAIIYAVQAVALRTSLKDPSGSKLIVKADAGYYIPSLNNYSLITDERLRRILQFVARDLEVASVHELINESDIALFDGSLFTFLWYGKLPEVPREFKFMMARPYRLRDLWRGIVNQVITIKSKAIPMFIAKSIRWSPYLRKLLGDDALSGLTSKVNDLLVINALRPRLPKQPHMLEPIYLERIEDLPKPLDTLDYEDRKYIEPLIPITITYVSFSNLLPHYQVSIPGKLSVSELIEVLSSLYPYSYGGYPDPLKVAHSKCKLSNEEFKYLLLKVGISTHTGREPLGEVA